MKVSVYNATVYTEEYRLNPELPDIFIVHIHICIPIYIYACIVINICVLKAQSQSAVAIKPVIQHLKSSRSRCCNTSQHVCRGLIKHYRLLAFITLVIWSGNRNCLPLCNDNIIYWSFGNDFISGPLHQDHLSVSSDRARHAGNIKTLLKYHNR